VTGRYTPGPMVAVVWHFWLGLFLAIGAIATILALGAGYLAKVQSMKYPKNNRSYPKRS